MKKLLVLLAGVLLTSAALHAGQQYNPFTGTLDYTGDATGGSGGGGGSAFIFYLSGGNVAFSTISFPGASVISDGQGASSVTFAPQINSTFTAFAVYAGTASTRDNLWINFRSTDGALFNTLISSMLALGGVNGSTAAIQTFLTAVFSTTSFRIDQIAAFSVSSGTLISVATAAFKTRYDQFTSSTQKQIVDALTFAASSSSTLGISTDAIKSALALSTAPLDQKNINGPITIYLGGVQQGNATTINFNTNFTGSMSGSTFTANGSAGGGGGGGGGAVFLYNGSGFVTVSTFSPNGATITSDGQGSSTFTWTPQILSTWTYFSAATTTLAAQVAALSVSSTIIFNQESPDISNRTYFLHNETTGTNGTYLLMASSPSVDPEITRTQSISVANGLVRISSHITPSGDPGVTLLPAGAWSFTSWASASNITALTQLVTTISTCAYDGTGITEVLSATETISDLSIDRFDVTVIERMDIALSTSDRIVVQYFGRTASALAVNVSLYYAGTAHASHLTTPIGSVYKFTQLTDAPSTLVGQQGKFLQVNQDQTQLVLVSSPSDFWNTTNSSLTALSKSTDAFKTFTLAVFSTQTTLFNNIIATQAAMGVSTDALKTFTLNVFSTQTTLFNTIISTEMVLRAATSTIQGFVAAEFSTQTALFDQVISTEMVLRVATASIQNAFAAFTATTAPRLVGDNFGSGFATGPANFQSVTASSMVATSSINAYGGFVSTVGYVGASATMTVIYVSGSSITFGGANTNSVFTLVFASAPAATVGNLLRITQINGSNYVIGAGGDAASTGGSGYATFQDEGSNQTQRTIVNCVGAGITCSDDPGNSRTLITVTGAGTGGGGVAFSFSPTNGNQAASTFSIVGTGFNKITYDGTAASSFTIGTSTLPYIMLTFPAQGLRGRPFKFGGSDTGNGVSITTNAGSTADGDGFIQLDYFSLAPSTRQYFGFQLALSSGGTNSQSFGSTVAWNYTGYVSSGAGAGKQVSLTLQGTCLGANANIQTATWGSSVTLNLPDITSNFGMRTSTKSAALTLGGTCFGGSLVVFRGSRQPQDGGDTLGGATGSYFNLTAVNVWVRKGDVYQDERYAQ